MSPEDDYMRFLRYPGFGLPVVRDRDKDDSSLAAHADDGTIAGTGITGCVPPGTPFQLNRIAYLERSIGSGKRVFVNVVWSVPSPRNTLTIGIGGVSCTPAQIKKRGASHSVRCCPTGRCLSAGGSVISLIGIPVPTWPNSCLIISRPADDRLSVKLDDFSFDVMSSNSKFSFATATPVIILTPDVFNIQMALPMIPFPPFRVVSETRLAQAVNGHANGDAVILPSNSNGVTAASTSEPKKAMDKTAAFKNAVSGSDPGLRFVTDPDETSCLTFSADNTIISRMSVNSQREQLMAHLNQSLEVGDKMVFMIEKMTLNQKSTHSLQIGFTLCDLTSETKIREHRMSCGRDRICQNAFSQAISPSASAGSVVSILRFEDRIDIEVVKRSESKPYPFKFPTNKKGGDSFIDPNRTFYPFVALNGCADSVRIVHLPVKKSTTVSRSEVTATAAIPVAPAPAVRQPFRLPLGPLAPASSAILPSSQPVPTKISGSSNNRFKFLSTPYENKCIRISSDGLEAERTETPGLQIVYFDRTMVRGDHIILKTTSANGQWSQYSYMFGVTTCNMRNIISNSHHVIEECSKRAPCHQLSVTVELRNFSRPGNKVRVDLNEDTICISTVDFRSPNPYFKRIGRDSAFPELYGRELHPFLILNSDVDAVEIITNGPERSAVSNHKLQSFPLRRSSVFSDDGVREMAESLVNSLDDRPSPPFQRLLKELEDETAAATDQMMDLSPSAAAAPEFRFLQPPYELDRIEISKDRKKAQRTAKTGARVVYFERELAAGFPLVLKVDSDNKFQHQRKHTFSFGLTTCDPLSIGNYISHMCGFCSDCGGECLSHNVLSSAHAGSFVCFEKSSNMLEVSIVSPSAGGFDAIHIPPAMMNKALFPYIELSGNADSVSVPDASSLPKAITEKKAIARPLSFKSGEAFLSKVNMTNGRSNGSSLGELCFLDLQYRHRSIEFLNGNQKIRRVRENGSMHVFFNRVIELDESFTLIGTNDNRSRDLRFEFGFTSCDMESIKGKPVHQKSACNPETCSSALVKDLKIRYETDYVSGVTVTRKFDHFAFDIGNGTRAKRFAKHFGAGKTGPQYSWIPFVRLNGDVSGLEIVLSPTLKEKGMNERPVTPMRTFSPLPSASGQSITSSNRSSREPSVTRVASNLVISAPPKSRAFTNVTNGKDECKVPPAREPVEENIRSALTEKKTVPSAPIADRVPMPVPKSKAAVVSPPTPTQSSRTQTPAAQKSSAKMKWYHSLIVSFEDNVIRRVDEAGDARCYIFASKFQIGEEIRFAALRNEDGCERDAKLVFGVTTRSLLLLEVQTLPVDASLLSRREYAAEFSVYPRLMSCIGIWDGLTLRRTQSGIALILDEDDNEIISVDENQTIYPFFQLSGCAVRIFED